MRVRWRLEYNAAGEVVGCLNHYGGKHAAAIIGGDCRHNDGAGVLQRCHLGDVHQKEIKAVATI